VERTSFCVGECQSLLAWWLLRSRLTFFPPPGLGPEDLRLPYLFPDMLALALRERWHCDEKGDQAHGHREQIVG